MSKYSFVIIILSFVIHRTIAQKTEIFITVTQNCANCNLIKSVYEELSEDYSVTLLFEEKLKAKEIHAYFSEIIHLPKNTRYIQSDSLWQNLGMCAGGSYVYILRGDSLLYTCNLKYFDKKRVKQILGTHNQYKKAVALPDSVPLVHFSDALLTDKKYYLLNTSLNKIYQFEYTTFKHEKTLSENSFSITEIWRAIYKDTAGITPARKILKKFQEKIPDQKMLKFERIDVYQDTLLIWASVFTPKIIKKPEPTVSMERTEVILWYHEKIHLIVPLFLPDSLEKQCYLAPNKGSIQYQYPNLYVPIGFSQKSNLNRNYMYMHYTFEKQNNISCKGFYSLQSPYESKTNFMNSYKITNHCLYFNTIPYYCNLSTQEMNRIDFLPIQTVSFNTMLQSWFIHYAEIEPDANILNIIIKLADKRRYYITVDKNGIIREKILLQLPFSIPSDIYLKNKKMIYVNEDKESIIVHDIP